MSQESLMEESFSEDVAPQRVAPPAPPQPVLAGRHPDDYSQDAEEDARQEAIQQLEKEDRKKRIAKLKEEIKKLWSRHPELELQTRDTLGEKLDDKTEQELVNILENMNIQLIRGTPLSKPELAILGLWNNGLKRVTGQDIFQELIEDPEIKYDIREMGTKFITFRPPWLDFLVRSGMYVGAKLQPDILPKIQSIIHGAPAETEAQRQEQPNAPLAQAPLSPAGGGQEQ